jgi:nanoRNase/pAp phosphatase (c-di-AMP/oligoRNAs hydrolase)
MTISGAERLRRFYSLFVGDDRVLIPINADPDAIASAMAIKRLLWRKTAGVTIANINKIERPDNLTMIRLIGVTLVPFEKITPTEHSRIVMVDSQPDHHPSFSNLEPQAVIDHHPVGRPLQAPFVDIRPRYGATATILVEYLRAAKIKPSAKLATGLYYAIKSDTSNFERQTLMEDLNAFQFVFRHSNIALARRIESAEMRLDFLKYFKKAMEVVRIRKGRAFVHLGAILHPDVCVQIADFFTHIDVINWSIVSGIYERKLVVILRNNGIRNNAGTVAKQAFEKLGFAGGHKSAARAEIPLNALDQSYSGAGAGAVTGDDQARLGRWVIRQIEHQAGTKSRPKT